MPDATPDPAKAATPTRVAAPAPVATPEADRGWLFPLLRVAMVMAIGLLAWYVAGHWNRWTGAALHECDRRRLYRRRGHAARREGLRLCRERSRSATIRSCTRATSSSRSTPPTIAPQLAPGRGESSLRRRRRSPISPIRRTCSARWSARPRRRSRRRARTYERYALEARRQRELLQGRLAGTPQLVEQADDNEKRTAAQLALNNAQLDQQKALLASLDVQEKQLQAQLDAAEAQVALAQQQPRLYADRLAGGRHGRPAPGASSASSSMSARR